MEAAIPESEPTGVEAEDPMVAAPVVSDIPQTPKKKKRKRSRQKLEQQKPECAVNTLTESALPAGGKAARIRSQNRRLPHDWAHLKPIGSVIGVTPFIPFKTPFNRLRSYPRHLRSEAFTTKRLLTEMEKMNLQLGLVVDLTDSDRYYQPARLIESKIKHVKIRVPGKGVPSLDTYRRFCMVVEKFLRQANGALIGVHCTHGINRTGWFVCRFLMERYGMDADTAMLMFDQARGHSMYRDYIIEDLKNYQTKLRPSLASSARCHQGDNAVNFFPLLSRAVFLPYSRSFLLITLIYQKNRDVLH
ncbi:RNA/RNP complex-1-interacting phosphatase homolog [Paramacrobiotus metropolitanus]|uniref:RNA/RNP complex-1-interacting phosphatase homolog n=1 Tax=Paramacrobiotus metropolitanus TaxID=2943436 RepID=UPI00244616EB|nr:RNA/RNP complex-1-interacting phosphatase homolog [Paramacrobiotus metropolitanus]